MSNVSRRQLIAGTGALCAAIATPSTGNAQLVYRHSDWKAEEFQELLHKTAHVRQVFDVAAINDGRFNNNIKNSLNGLEFGFGIAPKQVQIVAALHGAASQAPAGRVLRRRVHTWFDALRTLRFIHGMRDLCLPSLSWRVALGSAEFLPSSLRAEASPEAICRALAEAERVMKRMLQTPPKPHVGASTQLVPT